jgi:antirestriction protein
VDQDADLDKAQEAFTGKFDSEEDWAANYWEETGLLESIPESLRNYIDYEQYARDCRLGGDITFVRKDGEVWAFNNNV